MFNDTYTDIEVDTDPEIVMIINFIEWIIRIPSIFCNNLIQTLGIESIKFLSIGCDVSNLNLIGISFLIKKYGETAVKELDKSGFDFTSLALNEVRYLIRTNGQEVIKYLDGVGFDFSKLSPFEQYKLTIHPVNGSLIQVVHKEILIALNNVYAFRAFDQNIQIKIASFLDMVVVSEKQDIDGNVIDTMVIVDLLYATDMQYQYEGVEILGHGQCFDGDEIDI